MRKAQSPMEEDPLVKGYRYARVTPTSGPYQGLIGCQIDRRSDGMCVVAFPSGTYTMHGGAISQGVFDPRWVRRVE